MSCGTKDIITVLVVLVLVMGVAALITRLLWSTYNTINKSFKLLKTELIALGFARGATAEDGDTPWNMKSTCTSSHASEKWNRAITSLKSRNSSSFNHVLFFVLQHDDWYTDAERNLMKRLSAKYPFTNNQRIRINNPPSLQSEEDLDDYGAYDYDDNNEKWHNY